MRRHSADDAVNDGVLGRLPAGPDIFGITSLGRLPSGPDIFGDTSQGVPNPLSPHVHPYPTRYHGPIFNQPMFGRPYVDNGYMVPPYSGVGAEEIAPPDVPAPSAGGIAEIVGEPLWKTAVLASTVASVYHGYKRNDSIGWALWWGLMGGLFPFVTPVIAVAQGYGKRVK